MTAGSTQEQCLSHSIIIQDVYKRQDYICAGRIEKGTMPKNPVAVKSIVSTPLADAVAEHYGVAVSYTHLDVYKRQV